MITYTWFNAPSVQQNNSGTITTKTLSGTITVDTTALASIGEGEWRIGDSQESSITAWNFTVTGGANSYSRSDQSTNPFIDILGGGSFSLVASRTQLSVESGASLFLGNSSNSPSETAILWSNGQSGHQYVSNRFGNVNPDGWVTSAATTSDPEATLDAAFPSDGLGGWVIATAVPEPATFSMAIFGVVAAAWQLLRRRRWLLVSLVVLAAIGVGDCCETATATLIAYDPFNQPATATINGTSSRSPGVWPGGGQTWGDVAGTVGVASGSLNVPSGVLGLSTNGNSATLLNNAGTQVAAFRKLGTTYDTSTETDLWFSFLYRPADRTGGVGINEGISLFNNTTEVIFFGSDGNGDLVIRAVGGQSADNERFANTFLDATSKQTFQIVANIRGTTEYTIWVDPTGFDSNLGMPTGGTKGFLATGLQTFSFDTIRLGDDTTSSAAQGVATFDEFRMGTTAVEVVPEPSTWAMALGGVAAFFWRQSRRSRRSR